MEVSGQLHAMFALPSEGYGEKMNPGTFSVGG